MVLPRQRTMAELAEVISSRTKTLNEYIAKHNLSQPTFLADGSAPDYLPREDSDITLVRSELADASKELYDLSVGANGLLMTQSMGSLETGVLRTIYLFNIPSHVPVSGSISYEELAQKTRLEEDKLRRILCYAYTMRMFCEPSPGQVAHSATSRLLATEENGMDWLGHATDDILPGSAKQADALQKWFSLDSKEADATDVVPAARSGTAYALGTKKDLFSYWTEKEPHRVGRFLGAMKYVSRSSVVPGREIQDSFDWKSLDAGTVCDVGGSAGHKAKIIAHEAPQLQLVVQDLPDVVEAAKKGAANDDEMSKLVAQGRLRFEPYSFFTPQPNTEAKAYFFGRVFHDWGDADCVKILDNLVPSMQPGAYLVINDLVLSEPGTVSWSQERQTRMLDVNMMVAINSRERSLDRWRTLVEEGSKGKLKFVSHSHKLNVVRFVRED